MFYIPTTIREAGMFTPYAIPVGRSREPHEISDVRTPAQQAAVHRIVESDGFDHALNNPFTAEVGDYTGPFMFAYTTRDGVLHGVRISKHGKTLGHAAAAPSEV